MHEDGQVIHEGQRSFRSQVSYVNLVAVLIVSALMIVVWNSRLGAVVFAVLGIVWVALTLRSVIEVTDDGFTVRGMLRTRHLSWSETAAFVVVGFSGSNRPLLRSRAEYVASTPDGAGIIGVSAESIETQAVATRVPMFSVVAAVTSHGERFRVHGTASTPIDPSFPAQAAAELNRRLRQHNPSATAS
jgi:hypothetical protein